MIIVTESELSVLKEKIKRELIEEMTQRKNETLNTVSQKAYKDIFNQYFPEDGMDRNRRCKIQQAVCTANNVLRLRTKVRPGWSPDRGIGIRNESELQSAIYTYEELCKTFRGLYQEDICSGE